jgi:copper chaperone
MPDFTVSDMTCSGCVKALTGAVHDVDASATLDANLETKHIRVASQAAPETLAEAMRDAGFTVTINA